MTGLRIAMAVAAAVATAAPVAADPAPEPVPGPAAVVDPAAAPAVLAEFVPEGSGTGNPLAQQGSQPTGPFGLPDLSAYGPNLLLGQTAAPAGPGNPPTVVVPTLNAFNPEYLLGQHVTPAAPGEGSTTPGLGPDAENPGTGRIAFLRRLYEMYQAGALKGSLLGQQSPEEFAQQADDATPPPG